MKRRMNDKERRSFLVEQFLNVFFQWDIFTSAFIKVSSDWMGTYPYKVISKQQQQNIIFCAKMHFLYTHPQLSSTKFFNKWIASDLLKLRHNIVKSWQPLQTEMMFKIAIVTDNAFFTVITFRNIISFD